MASPLCQQCGGATTLLRAEQGTELRRCPHCSHVVVVTAGKAEGGGPGPALLAVALVWKAGQPSIDEVLALQKLLPELRHEQPWALVGRLGGAPQYDLGRRHRMEALELQRQGRKLGLDVRLA